MLYSLLVALPDVAHRQLEGPISSPEHIGQGSIPGNYCTRNAKPAADGQEDGSSTRQLSNGQEEVGQEQECEYEQECNIGSQCTKKQHACEDCPAEEEETKCCVIDSCVTDRAEDTEARYKDDTKSNQEASIGGEDGI